MCGVFGFVSKTGAGPNPNILQDIARATETRGRHAFGFAWIDTRGRLRMFKQTGRISNHLGVLQMAAKARMLIGHCRYATHGDPRNNLNNHPHPVDGGWFVHNGVIPDHREISAAYKFRPVSNCDSELLGLLIEEFDGPLVERCIEAVEIIGQVPLVMLALWRSPQRLVALRSGNPLHLGENAEGFYLASLPQGLPERMYLLRDHTALSFFYRHGEARLVGYDATPEALTI